MNQAQLVNPNSPVFANSYFDGTYDPTLGNVYRTGDVLSNLLDDYTGEEIQFKKLQNSAGITDDGVIYRLKDGEMLLIMDIFTDNCLYPEENEPLLKISHPIMPRIQVN